MGDFLRDYRAFASLSVANRVCHFHRESLLPEAVLAALNDFCYSFPIQGAWHRIEGILRDIDRVLQPALPQHVKHVTVYDYFTALHAAKLFPNPTRFLAVAVQLAINARCSEDAKVSKIMAQVLSYDNTEMGLISSLHTCL